MEDSIVLMSSLVNKGH